MHFAYFLMASTCFHFFILYSLLLVTTCLAQTPPPPKSLVLSLTKDVTTLQHVIHMKQRTPPINLLLTVDLGGKFLWTICEPGYTSSTYRPSGCRTPQCRIAKASKICETCNWAPVGPGCSANQCWTFAENTVRREAAGAQLISDNIYLNSIDGRVFTVPDFLFYCPYDVIMGKLAKNVTGMAGLGRTRISLPIQLATSLTFQKKFTLCLSSSTRSNGALLIGDGKYYFSPNLDVKNFLTYTPLVLNPKAEVSAVPGEASAEYYIGVKSIKINDKNVPVNTSLLSIDKGFGGTKISTVNPYTVLENTIHDAVVNAFVRELSNATRVAPVAPFEACFRSTSVGSTRLGAAVPPIDLVLQDKVYWRIFGANSMVQVNKNVMCLGVVKGGEVAFTDLRTSVIIGGHQIEDNLLEFDGGKKQRLGFSSSLLLHQTSCANFNYMSDA